MTQYFGDFSEDDTVYIPFNTFDSNDPSASVTITNLADADIKVHKDGSATQIVTDGATVAIDFDSITGNHLITVDTSAHADYSTGSDYLVRIEGTTVDGATINAWVGSFSIENRHSAGALRPTTAGRTLDVTATGAAGIDWGNVENASTAVDLSGTDIQLCDTITTYTGNTVQTGDTYALASGATGFAAIDTVVDAVKVTTDKMVFTVANQLDVNVLQIESADATDTIADAVWDETLTGANHNGASSAGKRLRQVDQAFVIAEGTAQAGAAGTITLAAGESSTTDIFAGDRVQIIAGTGVGEHGICTAYNGTTKVATMSQNWVIAPDATSEYILVPADVDVESWQHVTVSASATTNLPEVDAKSISDNAAAADNVQANIGNLDVAISNIETDTQDLQTQVGPAGAGLTDLGGMSTAMKAEVNAEADTALTDYDAPTNAELEARTPTAAQLAYMVANANTGLPVTFTTAGGSTTVAVINQVDGGAGSATDDQYNGRLLVFTDGTLKGVVTDITDYTGSTTTATITAIPTAPTSSHNARLI